MTNLYPGPNLFPLACSVEPVKQVPSREAVQTRKKLAAFQDWLYPDRGPADEFEAELDRSLQEGAVEGEQKVKHSVRVVRDPSGLYSPGATFSMDDLAQGVFRHTWPVGIEFEVESRGKSYRAEVMDAACIRSDGKVLRPSRGGRVGRWISIETQIEK